MRTYYLDLSRCPECGAVPEVVHPHSERRRPYTRYYHDKRCRQRLDNTPDELP
jgi:hypothetical protein